MRRFCIVALVLIATSVELAAKGPTVKLTLTGPGLGAPVEIVDPEILALSGVWDGGFIGRTLAAAPQIKGPVYTVAFDVQLPEGQRAGVQRTYTVRVARDARLGALFLYLPGRGEEGYTLNAGTMLREGQDGHWHRPSPTWAAAIAKYVP
jgi:hypothetical protein